MEVGKDLEVMLWYWNVHDYNHEIALLRVLRKTTESSNQHGYLAMLHLADSLQECNYQHNSASSSKYAYTLGDSGLIFSHFGLHVSQNVFNHHWIYWISSGIFENLRVRSGCMRFWGLRFSCHSLCKLAITIDRVRFMGTGDETKEYGPHHELNWK